MDQSHVVKSGEVDRYFAESLSWEQDRFNSAKRAVRASMMVAGAAVVVAITAVGALAMLAPLKKTDAYVITVDKSTGATEVATALTGTKPVTYDEVVSKFFLSQYVRLREGWVPSAIKENFSAVALMSDANEQNRYARFFDAKNPNSPQTVYGHEAIVDVKIRSVSFVNPHVAQVRYSKIIQSAGADPKASNWVSILSFQYASSPERESDRLINPLGFQVTTFRSDPEA